MSKKDWKLLKAYQATGLTPEGVERVKRERDAAVSDLYSLGMCSNCKFFGTEFCKYPVHCQFSWRGVKEGVCND